MERNRLHGFTLVELMVVVVIIGILAAVAYPAYTKQMTQTRRSDAKIALTQAASKQERFFSECNTYAGTLAGVRACATGILGLAAADPVLSPNGHYTLTVAAGNVIAGCAAYTCGFIITATPTAGGLQVGDGAFRIDALGTKQWDSDNNGVYNASEYTWGK